MMMATEPSEGGASGPLINTRSFNGIRVEQLCEILSQEIGRVREESVQQAHEMRASYEMELQALRNEIYANGEGCVAKQEL